MPSSNSGESRRASKPHRSVAAPPVEQENLPCPRCDSANTKFCYYNNYNYSQPRHFCKSCRRYWTHGGTLRDIPVGGGSRKNAKRSRTHHAAAATSSSSSTSSATTSAHEHHNAHTLTALAPVTAATHFGHDGDVKQTNGNACGSYTSLLNNTQGSGFFALGGFGLGLGHGFDDMGFGIGRSGWAFPGMVDNGNIGGAIASSGVNTWQLESGEGGFVGGDCFSWPGLAISTPGNGLK